MATDWRQARLSAADQALLGFGEKLTLSPDCMSPQDIQCLRQHGFADREILSVTLAAAYRNFITRVADALGVELRRGESYSPEVLRAFGVSAEEARTTMYADRTESAQLKGEGESSVAALETGNPLSKTSTADPCWIRLPDSQEEHFAQLRAEWEQRTAPSPMRNLALAFHLRPKALEETLGFGRLVTMGGSGLGRRIEAIIGLVVAATRKVPYMMAHHAQTLSELRATKGEVESLMRDPFGGTLQGKEREIARFCRKTTREPSRMTRSDVETLRRAGLDEREILTVVAGGSFENFLALVAAGLGVRLELELESAHEPPPKAVLPRSTSA